MTGALRWGTEPMLSSARPSRRHHSETARPPAR